MIETRQLMEAMADVYDLIEEGIRRMQSGGDPPYMLMIDRRPRARTQTVDDAAVLAAQLLAKTVLAAGVPADQRAPSEAARRLG